jgi:hypothetical protein
VARVGNNAGQKMMFWTIMSMIFAAGDRGDHLASGLPLSRSGDSLQPADSRHLGDFLITPS